MHAREEDGGKGGLAKNRAHAHQDARQIPRGRHPCAWAKPKERDIALDLPMSHILPPLYLSISFPTTGMPSTPAVVMAVNRRTMKFCFAGVSMWLSASCTSMVPM